MVITMAKLRMAHASTHGARKPPGPKVSVSVSNFDTINQKSQSQSQKRNIGLAHTYFFKDLLIIFNHQRVSEMLLVRIFPDLKSLTSKRMIRMMILLKNKLGLKCAKLKQVLFSCV